MNIDTFYAIIVIIIIGVIAHAYMSSEHYYKQHILQHAFEKLKDGEYRALNPEMNWFNIRIA